MSLFLLKNGDGQVYLSGSLRVPACVVNGCVGHRRRGPLCQLRVALQIPGGLL
jgi:hypothetical protein